MGRSTLKHSEAMYKPSFAGYVDVDLVGKKLSLRSLVSLSSSYFTQYVQFSLYISLLSCELFFIDFLLFVYFQIDNSVVESFGAGGKTCITSRVYPTLAIHDNTHLFAFNNGTEKIKIETLNAWSMGTSNIT